MESRKKIIICTLFFIIYTALVSFISIEIFKAYARNKINKALDDVISDLSFGQKDDNTLSLSNDTSIANNQNNFSSFDTQDVSNDVEIGELKIKITDSLTKDSNGNPIINEASRIAVIVGFNITNKTSKPMEGLMITIDIKDNYGQTLGTIFYNATNELVPQKKCTIGTFAEFKGEKVRYIMNADNIYATVRKVEIKK